VLKAIQSRTLGMIRNGGMSDGSDYDNKGTGKIPEVT
jgi:hypothetical protein